MVDETDEEPTNVLGEPLKPCCSNPETGFYRDGTCRTGPRDRGNHTVCAVMTEEFLNYTAAQGNDLSTARPEMNFPGLEPGDRWCLCAPRWKEAHEAGKAPPVILEACDQKTLEFVDLETLQSYEIAQA